MPKGTTAALETLYFLKTIEGTFHSCEIALRILATIPVTLSLSKQTF